MFDDGIHFSVYHLLPYQRNVMIVDSARGPGKTFGVQGYMLEEAIHKDKVLMDIMRTKDEVELGAFEGHYAKVIMKCFSGYNILFSKREMILVDDDDNKRLIGHCVSLSEYRNIKKTAFPTVYNMHLDEYLLEQEEQRYYIHGWKEPSILMNLYHTVDREEDRVKLFLTGNTTLLNNPYRLHFNLPYLEPGQIYKDKFVIYERAVRSDELQKLTADNKFLRMIDGTDYGYYAKEGKYKDQTSPFIESRSAKAQYLFTIKYLNDKYGIWQDLYAGKVYVDYAFDPSGEVFALTLDDHNENTLLTKGKSSSMIDWLARVYKASALRYTDVKIKYMMDNAVKLIV